MARVSSPEERLALLNMGNIAQYVGFSFSPFLSNLLAAYLSPKDTLSQSNLGFFPGMVMCLFSGVMLLLLFFMRKYDTSKPSGWPHRDSNLEQMESFQKQSFDVEGRVVANDATIYQERKLTSCFLLYMFLNFTLRGILGSLETNGGSQYQSLLTGVNEMEKVAKTIEFFSWIGVPGLIIYLVLPTLVKKYKSVPTLMFGIIVMSLGSFLILPSTFGKTLYGFVPAVLFIWSIGSPITQTLTISSYSEMMGSKPQGAAMGWLTTAGSLGRAIFPLAAGGIYNHSKFFEWFNIFFLRMVQHIFLRSLRNCSLCFLRVFS